MATSPEETVQIHDLLHVAERGGDHQTMALCRVALDPELRWARVQHLAIESCLQIIKHPHVDAAAANVPARSELLAERTMAGSISTDLMPCRYEIRIHEPGKAFNWVWSTHNNYERACAEFNDFPDLTCEDDPPLPPGTLIQLRDLGEDRVSSMTINDMTREG